MILRNLREVGGEPLWRDMGPRPVERPGPEPAPGDQHVRVAALRIDEHVARRVGDLQEARPVDRCELRLALELEQLGRTRAYVDRRELTLREQRLQVVTRVVEEVDLARAGDGRLQLRERRRRRSGRSPRPLDRRRLDPAVREPEIVAAALRIERHQRPRVDDPHERRLRHRAQRGFAIDEHQEGRRLAHDDARRIVLERRRLRPCLCLVDHQVRLQSVQPDGVWRFAEVAPDRGQRRRAAIGGSREIRFGDLDVTERHETGGLVHARARGEPDHPVARLW